MSHLSGYAIALLLVLAPAHAAAQSAFERNPLDLTMTPAYPKPGELVRIQAKSFTLDLDALDLSWKIDGKVFSASDASIELRAPRAGDVIEVVVEAMGGGDVFSASIEVRPASVSIVWEADSYTPPFYRGRALPSAGTALRAEAIPHLAQSDGREIVTKDIIFTWRRDGQILSRLSGRGKNTAILSAPTLFDADTISVRAESVDGSIAAENSFVIGSVEPQLVLYQEHPLFGTVLNNALNRFHEVSESEMTFSAIPYFADISQADDTSLVYEWSFNGETITTDPEKPNRITVRTEGGGGLGSIGLEIFSEKNILETASALWDVMFSRGTSNSTQAGDVFRPIE